jgi:hypothetical protein
VKGLRVKGLRERGELLIERLQTGAFSKRRVVLPVHLQVGESTG